MIATPSTDSTQRVVLHDISWNTFEQMLAEMGDHRSARLAYFDGTLEIMSPSPRHERINRLLERFVLALTQELALEVYALGSTTWKIKPLAGVEPNSCYYIQHESAIRALAQQNREIDLTCDPPPDLIIEVDIASSSRPKFAIYTALKVPEIWLYRDEKLEIYHFDGTAYRQHQQSLALPGLRIADDFARFVQLAQALGQNAAERELRTWVRDQVQRRPGGGPL
ncbi:Uma2 family endonuclease [Gloeobacter violaceus]|uniref:Gll2958 protein n=1 Tax=Gloeobacter violaceus (strain ATCC 29082 / PCC 7421) TaxID=251221 RepID=Q7NCM0_GLOVI|nr:Uma2 family endonuclease [Gloeobacter violaceus]BAC90899.1 gll2958 [Gloeobacter violaceus PCC 7421]